MRSGQFILLLWNHVNINQLQFGVILFCKALKKYAELILKLSHWAYVFMLILTAHVDKHGMSANSSYDKDLDLACIWDGS